VWPEEEVEDLVCDVTRAIITVILIDVVTTSEDPISRFTIS
jgi:hypothetical protein